ncbi:MAG: DUF883 domain-containing protein [Candidatus Jettenia sp.]|uniref:DUF883 domain-containing protein n=1 Tax=Candidatus Jettenia caeni TaxID=247490 RepID=I3IHU5_9BACT|nr:DUF883 family protein [Candidatus Jettenia sp. AMX1]MBC6930023.1 DUF883 domain-containing protein [Candidatus Jettenia sp.]NUN23261.1 DUF883 domain-containing protein [Candidatus Jettenia caeni]KAA0248335.1 MAG: DUF883 domain-containing protein [Candidatus Jettenia sp. AMX1]MCE7881679.1 DUF883 domain-containing protein [Candidatus Jettenia sp. AMX1]MCQ3928339.1 DUF883 domain-containing protein [Candidatus Jettenia sp.]
MDNKTKENAGSILKIDEALEFLNRELAGKKDEINRLISEKYSNLKEIIGTGKEMMEKTKQTLEDAVGKGEEKVKEMTTEIDKRVHTNPWLAIGIAAASGLLLGYIIEASRRSK